MSKAPVPPVKAQFNNASGARPLPPKQAQAPVPDSIKNSRPSMDYKPKGKIREIVDKDVREQAAIQNSKQLAAARKPNVPKMTRKAEFNANAKGLKGQFNRAGRGR